MRFSLTHQVTAADLREMVTLAPPWRRRRVRAAGAVAAFAFLTLLGATAAVWLTRSPVPLSETGAVAIYPVVIFGWSGLVIAAYRVLIMSPQRMARGELRSNPEWRHGHRDEVGPAGVTSIAPDGTTTFIPWTAIARVHEGPLAFHLVGHNGRVKAALPKRGLDSPGSVPLLRDFLSRAAGQAAA